MHGVIAVCVGQVTKVEPRVAIEDFSLVLCSIEFSSSSPACLPCNIISGQISPFLPDLLVPLSRDSNFYPREGVRDIDPSYHVQWSQGIPHLTDRWEWHEWVRFSSPYTCWHGAGSLLLDPSFSEASFHYAQKGLCEASTQLLNINTYSWSTWDKFPTVLDGQVSDLIEDGSQTPMCSSPFQKMV